jgi:hypothetical protein
MAWHLPCVHAALARYGPACCVGVLAGDDVQDRIRSALHATEGSRRRRRPGPLHPLLVFWLVLCLPLHRCGAPLPIGHGAIGPTRSLHATSPLTPASEDALLP